MNADPRLAAAFDSLAARGKVAGAGRVFAAAVAAAAGEGGSGPTSVAPASIGDGSAPGPFVPLTGDIGRPRRRPLAPLLVAAAAVVAVIGAIVVRAHGDGQIRTERPGGIGDPGPNAAPDDGSSDTTPVFAETTAGVPDTIGVTTTIGLIEPCTEATATVTSEQSEGSDGTTTTTTAAPATLVEGELGTTTTVAGPPAGKACLYPGGSLPPAGADGTNAPYTVPADAELAWWRFLPDVDLAWRQEGPVAMLYWRTPAGRSSVVDDFGGAAVLVASTTDGYVVIAKSGHEQGDSRPQEVAVTFSDGSMATFPLVYPDLGSDMPEFGYARIPAGASRPTTATAF